MDPIVYRAMYRFLILDAKKKIDRGLDPDKIIDDLLKALRQLNASIISVR